jgi:gamma-polyglutamate biosynthesis protein CapA
MERNNSFFITVASILAITLGSGAIWVGTYGLKLVINRSIPIDNTRIISTDSSNSTINSESDQKTKTSNIYVAIDAIKKSFATTTNFIDFSAPSLKIMIGGDVMLDRKVRQIGEKNGYESLFEDVTPLFKTADIVLVNLEGPITNKTSSTLLPNGATTKELDFTFATDVAGSLSEVGINLVSLANNHTDNKGYNGFNETKKWLNNAGVQYFGDPWNSTSTERIITKRGFSVAFVGYHAFQSGFDRTVRVIKELSNKGHFVIVVPHWGEEYITEPTDKMRTQAQALVTAGANAVIGAHPHVLIDHEWIANVPVFYSLGNLLFDQYFSPEVMKGNIVELELAKDGDRTYIDIIKVYETSTASKKGITVNMEPRVITPKR